MAFQLLSRVLLHKPLIKLLRLLRRLSVKLEAWRVRASLPRLRLRTKSL
jgi:hypothetical protein